MYSSLHGPHIFPHIIENVDFTPFGCFWLGNSPNFVIFGETTKREGLIKIFELKKQNLLEKKVFYFPHSIRCGAIIEYSNHQTRCAFGNIKGEVIVLDISEGTHAPFVAHTNPINCLISSGELSNGPIDIATASDDVKVWDSRTKDEILLLTQGKKKPDYIDCWSLSFASSASYEDRCLAAGYENGDLKIFDMKAGRFLLEENLGCGICSTQFDKNDIKMNKLGCATMGGKLFIINMRHEGLGFYSCLRETIEDGRII